MKKPTPKIYRTTNWYIYNWALIKYELFSSQWIMWVIRKSLGIYLIKFRWMSRLIQSIQMGLMIQNNASSY